MELRQLEYFLAIAKSENMTQAANLIHVSQPTLSTTLRDLERELGFSLFNRMGKRLELNDSGRNYSVLFMTNIPIFWYAWDIPIPAHFRSKLST